MKKRLAITLIAVLVLTLAACGGGGSGGSDSLSGTYVFESGDGSGIKLVFSRDGTLITTFVWPDGEEHALEGGYELQGDGVMLITDPDGDASESEYSLDGRALTIDGITYTKK